MKTSISFGLVYIPVVLKPSVKPNDISFNLIDKKTKSRVKYEKTCVDCDGRIVRQDDIIKGYQYEKDQYVFFTDEDFENIKAPKDKTISIEKFVCAKDIDPIYYEKAYYVTPDKSASKAFSLLCNAMTLEKRVGVAKTVIGTKEHLVTLRPTDGGLVLNTMYFDDEVQIAPSFNLEKPSSDETKIAKTIINNMTGKFVASDYKDEYREKILKAIELKIAGKKIVPMKRGKPAQIINLMDALKLTLEAQ